ncbi:hypothetical protein AVEN_67208-1 [Araneus ventricosus]|uniref:STPR domain-containing protein n=1 Tax=Araneus ventricosus TaxID=182803 RepID=A0A4Y2L130_ARAVE|nr:hypothetical protein AVEN_67208-1 [Araneus ventricosus]
MLKLLKKETTAQRNLDRRAEETEEQNNSRLSVMAQSGHERRAEETEGQRNSRLSAMERMMGMCLITSLLTARERRIIRHSQCNAGPRIQKAIMKRERRVAATDEEGNRRFSTMEKSGKDRRRKIIADCQQWHNVAGREERKKPKKNEIENCQTWHNVDSRRNIRTKK